MSNHAAFIDIFTFNIVKTTFFIQQTDQSIFTSCDNTLNRKEVNTACTLNNFREHDSQKI